MQGFDRKKFQIERIVRPIRFQKIVYYCYNNEYVYFFRQITKAAAMLPMSGIRSSDISCSEKSLEM